MRRDQLGESRLQAMDVRARVLLGQLVEYGTSAPHVEQVDEAFELYWGGLYDSAGLSEEARASTERFLEWYVLDYHPSKAQRIVDLFAEGPGRSLPDELAPLLEAWRTTTLGLYRVEGTSADRLALHDLLRDEPTDANDAALARSARRSDLLVGRIYQVEGARSVSVSSMLLPPAYEPAMAAYVHNAYSLYRRDHPGASWDAFLVGNGHIFIAFMLSARGEALRALIGPGTRYDDPAIARNGMRAYTVEKREREREAQEVAQRPLERRTAAGLVLLGEESPAANRPTILLPGRDG